MISVTMRTLLLLRLVLVGVGVLLSTVTRAHESINNNIDSSGSMTLTERDQAIAGVEASLLSMLGFAKRPKPQGKAHIPESLKKLYALQNSIGIADIALPGIHSRSANTVRSFAHVG